MKGFKRTSFRACNLLAQILWFLDIFHDISFFTEKKLHDQSASFVNCNWVLGFIPTLCPQIKSERRNKNLAIWQLFFENAQCKSFFRFLYSDENRSTAEQFSWLLKKPSFSDIDHKNFCNKKVHLFVTKTCLYCLKTKVLS